MSRKKCESGLLKVALGVGLVVVAITTQIAPSFAETIDCYECVSHNGCQNGGCLVTKDEEGNEQHLCCVGGAFETFYFCEYTAECQSECDTTGSTTACSGCYSFSDAITCSSSPCNQGESVGQVKVQNCTT